MGLTREMVRAASVTAAAGLAVGGVFGLLSPVSASASSNSAAAAPAVVTSVDLLGREQLDVTVRFTNTGRSVERLDFQVLADGRPLVRRSAPPSVDLGPGMTADETVTFAAPPLTADLTLTLEDGSQLPLEL